MLFTVTKTPKTSTADAIRDIAAAIKRDMPAIESLSPEQIEALAMRVITERLTAELSTAVDFAGIDWTEERETFLGDTKSPHTRRAYAAALDRLAIWAARERIRPLSMTTAQADRFIRDLKATGKAPASVRRDIAAVSAFFTFLERYHTAVKNPLRGTRIRPPHENRKETVVPAAEEVGIIIARLPPVERAVVMTLAYRGLRAGALPTLEKRGNRYYGTSKGKTLQEGETYGITLPENVITGIKEAGLDPKRPFAVNKDGNPMTANALERRINYHIGKLYNAGTIKAPYSCHDFRHYFAITEYKKTKDILKVSRLLNHAGIQTTQTYLRTLGLSV
jgi:site-specific recombinase XerD